MSPYPQGSGQKLFYDHSLMRSLHMGHGNILNIF